MTVLKSRRLRKPQLRGNTLCIANHSERHRARQMEPGEALTPNNAAPKKVNSERPTLIWRRKAGALHPPEIRYKQRLRGREFPLIA
jgi:hypothetical protein